MSSFPIGFFDSGIGGISLWKAIKKILPNENSIYLSDSKNCPYGLKSKDKLDKICIKNTEFLIDKGCKMIIVACNTATTNSISILRNKYKIPFIGIEPAIKPAALRSKTKKIGILATKGTLTSDLFSQTSSDYISDINIITKDGEGLVKLIENGNFSGNEIETLLNKYLDPMINYGIDQLVLGCTHYPLVKKAIKKIINDSISIVDCNAAVAIQTKKVLNENEILNDNVKNDPSHTFYNSGNNNFIIKKLLDNKYEINNFE
jgi:glutamate racemase